MLCALTMLLTQDSCCGDMKVFASDPAFIASHAAPLPLHFQPAAGKMITFKTTGHTGNGFFVPAKAGNKSAILVFQEWWGLNDYIKREAERLHDELGSAVLAVDMYDGKVADKPEDAGKLMSAMKEERGVELVKGALGYVKSDKIGTIGWCFGGGWSHKAAILGGSRVKGCVIYYGMPTTDPAQLAKLKAPVLMHWGTQDGFINKKVVSDFEVAMKKAHKPLKTHAFNAVHAFANPSNPKYDKAAAATANKESVAFLKQHLK